ncbi:MAG: glycosyltransferase [Chloroflexi bacterium]|nr:glycosyltransferase [Chloroflexota bacterium]
MSRVATAAVAPARAHAEDPVVSIVIPVYNEAENITGTLERLASLVRTPMEILVVHDFDEDTTVPVVRSLQARIPQVRLLRNDLGRGVLHAMRAGIAAARAPYVVISMADGSDDVAVIDRMVELAEQGADVVAASRYIRGGRQVGGPRLKGLMSRTAGLTLQWFGRVGTHDATNNFKLYSRRHLDSVTIESSGGFELALELTVKAALAGRVVREIPATWHDRTAGESRFRLRAWLPRYLHWYLSLFSGRVRSLRP